MHMAKQAKMSLLWPSSITTWPAVCVLSLRMLNSFKTNDGRLVSWSPGPIFCDHPCLASRSIEWEDEEECSAPLRLRNSNPAQLSRVNCFLPSSPQNLLSH